MNRTNPSNGSVYFRKDRNRWIAQYSIKDYTTGKMVIKRKGFMTEKEANDFLKSLQYQKENPAFIEHNGIPLVEIMRLNLKRKKDTNLISEAQYQRVDRSIKKIEESFIANKNVDEITTEDIQGYLNSQVNYSDSTIKKLKEQFGQAFNYAMNKGYIQQNPMLEVIRPKSLKETPPIRAMTLDEESKFVDYITSKSLKECPYRNEFLIQLFMGLRIGECLALSTSDIDLANKRMYVHRTLTTDLNGRVIMSKSTKTKAGIRYLPISPSLYPYIVEQMKVAEERENNPEKLLFRTTNLPYADKEIVNRSLDRILKKLTFDHMSSHSLRHTYATRSIEAGVTPVVLQKLMGHTDVSITLNTYTSVFDKYKETELEKVNQYYMKENLLTKPKTDDKLLGDGTIIVDSKEYKIEDNTKNENNIKEIDEKYER